MKDQFQYTEFGLIPNDWVYCKFKDALDTFSSGATPYRAINEYYEGNVRWVSSGELNYNTIYETIEHISEKAVKNTNLRRHKAGTFLMAITGLEAEGTRGRCAILGDVATTNQSCLAINGTDRLCVDFLFVFYKMWGNYLAFKYCQGSKQQSYTANIVRSLPIYFPSSIKEQQKIAEALRDINLLIEGLKQKIAKKRAIKEGVMQQLLTGKKRLAGFSEPWVERRLGEVCFLKQGYAFSSATYNSSGKYSVVTIANVQEGKFDTSCSNKLLSIPIDIQEHQVLQCGDLLISMTGNVGRVCLVNTDKCLLNQRVGKLVSSNIDTKYLFHILNSSSFIDSMILKAKGAAQLNLSKSDIEDFKIIIANSIAEQQAIAQILTDIDNEIAELEQKQKKYTNLKQGAMQKLLTGQIRLKI